MNKERSEQPLALDGQYAKYGVRLKCEIKIQFKGGLSNHFVLKNKAANFTEVFQTTSKVPKVGDRILGKSIVEKRSDGKFIILTIEA